MKQLEQFNLVPLYFHQKRIQLFGVRRVKEGFSRTKPPDYKNCVLSNQDNTIHKSINHTFLSLQLTCLFRMITSSGLTVARSHQLSRPYR